jgi:Na+-translocating ferredoxin:NAD+ oxidoreductase RnfC subunit
MKEERRVPLSMLRRRLRVEEYESETPYDPVEPAPARVRIKLSQHVGKPAAPVVRKGEKVRPGQLLAAVGEKDLGVNIHSSIAGKVAQITDKYIEVRHG